MPSGISISLTNMQNAINASYSSTTNERPNNGFTTRIVQEERRNEAYENIFNARLVLNHAASNSTRVKSLLTDIQTKATTAADASTSTTDRATLVSEINTIAARINDRIEVAQYEDSPLLDGSFSGENRLKFVTGLTTNVDTQLPDYIDLQSNSDNVEIASTDDDSGELIAQYNGSELTSDTETLIFSKFENEVAEAIDLVSITISDTSQVTGRLDARVARLADRELLQTESDEMQSPQTTMQKLVDSLNSNPISSLQVQGNLTTGGFIRLLNSNA